MADRNPFGIALSNSLLNDVAPIAMPTSIPQPQKMGRGQLIAGILADALAGAMGRSGPFAARMAHQQQQEQEEAQWGRRLEREHEIKARYDKPDVPPMVRDAEAWRGMTPEQRAAYQEMQGMKAGDPEVFVTLPNGQVYAGPKSGLAAALTGGGSAPARPVGKLTPINGGQTPPASGGFRPY